MRERHMVQQNNNQSGFDQAAFDKIIEEYRQAIPGKLETMQNLINEMHGTIQEDKLKELRFIVHKLAGNAGIYGYPQVSVVCKQFDDLLIEKLKLFALSGADPTWVHDFDLYLNKVKEGFNRG